MDYYLVVVDVELNFHQLKMDCYLDAELLVLLPDDLQLQRSSQPHLVHLLEQVLAQLFLRGQL